MGVGWVVHPFIWLAPTEKGGCVSREWLKANVLMQVTAAPFRWLHKLGDVLIM